MDKLIKKTNYAEYSDAVPLQALSCEEKEFHRSAYQYLFKSILKYIRIRPKALEVGIGRGHFFDVVIAMLNDAIGVEYSKSVIDKTLESYHRNKLLQADILSLPFIKSSMNSIFAFEVLEHIYPEKIDTAIGEINRILKEGGHFVGSIPTLKKKDYEPEVSEFIYRSKRSWDGVAPMVMDLSEINYNEDGTPHQGHVCWASRHWWITKFERHGFRALEKEAEAIKTLLEKRSLSNWWDIYSFVKIGEIGHHQKPFMNSRLKEQQEEICEAHNDKIAGKEKGRSDYQGAVFRPAMRFVEKSDSSCECSFQGLRNMGKIVNRGIKVEHLGLFFKTDRRLEVLLIKLDHRGDFVLALPAIMKLKEKVKEADIDIVVGEWNAALAKKLGIFRNIFVYNFFQMISSVNPGRLEVEEKHLLANLGKYDIAIDLRRPSDTRFLISRVDAVLKVGYTSFSEYDKNLDICLDTDDATYEFGKAKQHNLSNISLQMLKLIDHIPLDCISLPKIVSSSPSQKNVAIFTGAGQDFKRWPVENFAELARLLINKAIVENINVYFAKSEESQAQSFRGIANVRVFVGLEFDEFIESLGTNCLSIGNNSFGVHVSSLLGIPVVGIYGGHETRWEWHPPFGANSIIYSDIDCSPCHIDSMENCPIDLVCLRQITPDYVLSVIKNRLEEAERAISITASKIPDRIGSEFTSSFYSVPGGSPSKTRGDGDLL